MKAQALFRYDLKLVIRAPILIGGGSAPRFGVDALQLRNPDGRAIIPDTHLKGVLRAAWNALEAEGISLPLSADVAFGREGSDIRGGTDVDDLNPQNRGAFLFRDLVSDEQYDTRQLTRVALNGETGSADDGKLLTLESIAPPGAPVTFRGYLLAWLDGADEAKLIEQRLHDALQCIFAIGKGKTVGYGQIIDRLVSSSIEIPLRKIISDKGEYFNYRFRLDKRLLVNTERPDNNTQAGEPIIPGGVLKGALAEKLRRSGIDPTKGDIGRALSRLIISHAEPFSTAGPPETGEKDMHRHDAMLRLDTVALAPRKPLRGVKNDQCAFRWDADLQISREPDWPIADFVSDTKEDPFRCPAAPNGLERRPNLTRDTRVRNAIDPKRGAAEDGKLFTESAIHPRFLDKPLEWRGTVYCPDGVNDVTLACLELLKGGLVTVGKTASATTVNSETTTEFGMDLEPENLPEALRLSCNQRVEVEILTPALMLREFHLSSERRFSEALQTYWETVGQQAFRIAVEDVEPLDETGTTRPRALDFFCQVELRAGYQALKHTFFGEKALEPFVLVKPGSLFRLEIVEPALAQDILRRLTLTGLPVARWSSEPETGDPSDGVQAFTAEKNLDFQTCPFTPQNGFGQVRVRPFQVSR